MAGNLKGDGNVYNPMSLPLPKGLPADEVARIQEQAIEYSANIKFHQSFILPPNPTSGRPESIRVTYADAGFSQSDTLPGEQIAVLLWCGGMFGGRYQAVAYDDEARRHRVRLIAVDKPGIGGTGKVALEQRISTWLDIVPALLKHLGIQHVSLACHSNGAIYILNTVLHQRELLDPERPFVALFGAPLSLFPPTTPIHLSVYVTFTNHLTPPLPAPWVLPCHSGKHHLTLLQSLPASLLGTWHHIARFVNTTIAPLRSQTSPAPPPTKPQHSDPISQTIALVPSSSKSASSVPTTTATTALHARASQSVLQSLLTKYIFLESIDGASQEVLLCLQKQTNPSNRSSSSALPNHPNNNDHNHSGVRSSNSYSLWGSWKDYDEVAAQLRDNEERFFFSSSATHQRPPSPPPELQSSSFSASFSATTRTLTDDDNNPPIRRPPSSSPPSRPHPPRPLLRLQCFFACADELVGRRGQAWFEGCWAGDGDDDAAALSSSSSSSSSLHSPNNNNDDDDENPSPPPATSPLPPEQQQQQQQQQQSKRSWIDFRSEVIPDSNHNSVLPVERGAIGRVLAWVGGEDG